MNDTIKPMRRVAGIHNIRLDGMVDLLGRAKGATVFDIGCNRGMVGYEFYLNGARLVHGCDIYEDGIKTAREVFADCRDVQSQFEIADLTQGAPALAPFGKGQYDIVVCLATYHKLKRIMPAENLSELMVHFGRRTDRYFAWRGTSEKFDENEDEMRNLDRDMAEAKMKRIHTSYMSNDLGVCAVWSRK